MLYALYLLIAAIGAFGLVASILIINKQTEQSYDKEPNRTTVKHKVMANPVYLSYLLLTVLSLSGIAILMYIFGP